MKLIKKVLLLSTALLFVFVNTATGSVFAANGSCDRTQDKDWVDEPNHQYCTNTAEVTDSSVLTVYCDSYENQLKLNLRSCIGTEEGQCACTCDCSCDCSCDCTCECPCDGDNCKGDCECTCPDDSQCLCICQNNNVCEYCLHHCCCKYCDRLRTQLELTNQYKHGHRYGKAAK